MNWSDLLNNIHTGNVVIYRHKKSKKEYFFLGLLMDKTTDKGNVLYSARKNTEIFTREEQDFFREFDKVR